jgi:hypothetical protein
VIEFVLWSCWYVAISAASCITLINLYLIVAAIVTHRSQPTLVPLIAGLVAALAFTISPMHSLQQIWWLPLLADPAGLVFVLVEMVRMQFTRVESRPSHSFMFQASAHQAFNPTHLPVARRVA